MGFSYLLPTEIRFGRGVVQQQAETLALGKHAFIVTGAHSGRVSGALQDVTDALGRMDIAYSVFEGIGNNLNVRQCKQRGHAGLSQNAARASSRTAATDAGRTRQKLRRFTRFC